MDLLEQAYNQDNYLAFLASKFNFRKLLQAPTIDNEDVQSFQQLGFITTADNKQLPVFEIYIKPNTQLARNRVQLRNLVAKQVQTQDGALAVYVDDKNAQWRFSFIAIEYKLNENNQPTTEQTASKRFTYLLGRGTQIRTAKERFGIINKQSTLENLKAAFSVEKLSKEFYDKLYKWYQTAQKSVVFPNDEGENQAKHIQNSLIRLLTRLLFIWFLKEKHLINPDLFAKDKLKNIIDWQKNSSFYKAILQNLFFATLNRKIDKRSFCNSGSHFVTNIYRYNLKSRTPLFKITDEDIKKLFEQTPFLNGGLFECLDRELTEDEKIKYPNRQQNMGIRIDGFSNNPKNPLKIPNKLFFNNEQDLGLIDIFYQYQFTVEESTPLDIEVALDPELLGKVFENLLANYRKLTGSFYTPREIVNYMVDESLKQHFKTHTQLTDKQINSLFTEGENTLNEAQIKTIISTIDTLKILDPAVGSGAYPMGILQRLVFILNKIDPENNYFKQQQLDKVEKIPDNASRNSAYKAIEQVFSVKNKHNSYGKKLFLIESCIYGVDIQPIAILIAQLRFFISLTIEQQPDPTEENYGIIELPNLETKFIVANSLLPLGEIPKQRGLFDGNIEQLQQQLLEIRHKYFTAKTLKTKRKYREQDQQTRQTMLNELSNTGITKVVEQRMQKVVHWDLYNQNAIADWFDPEWQFGVKNGFDIVIGNPPYVTYGLDKQYKTFLKSVNSRIAGVRNTRNMFAYFIEKAITLLSEKGTLTFIVPHSVSRVDGYKYIRQYISDNAVLWQIIDEYDQFNNVTLEMVTLFCSKNIKKPEYIKSLSNRENKIYQLPINIYDICGYYPIYYDKIYEKINQYCSNKINGYRGFSSLKKDESSDILYIGGKNIKEYQINLGYKESYINKPNIKQLKSEEIVITQFGASLRGAIIDTSKIIPSGGCVIITHNDSLLPKFVLALINSQTIKYFFDRYIVNNAGLTVHLDGHYLSKIPIPKISTTAQQPFINLVDKILAKKQNHQPTITLEAQIDNMVYRLYNLSADEIKIIEGKNE